MESEAIKQIKEKSKEILGLLRANFNPHTSIIIDDSGLKILTTELFEPIQFCDKDKFQEV